MKRNLLVTVLVAIGGLLAAGGFYLGRHAPVGDATSVSAPATAEPRKVLYWHDPMVPGQRFDKPGKSPFMDMQLVPVYADEAAGDSGVTVNAAVQQSLGIRTAAVRRADVSSSFDAVGTVQFDERLSVAVQTRVAGFVERLTVRAPMEQVRKGQALATVFAPEWLGPQNELLALQRTGASSELVAAARDRMRAMSIPDSLIRQSEQAGTAQARYTLVSPLTGVVSELGVREGVAVSAGMTLFRITGVQRVWAVAEIPEAQAARLSRGQRVKAVLQADAAQTFSGELTEILPQISASSRTLQARFEVDNTGARLVPGMLLRLQIAGPSASRLLVPSEAVIRTGQRAVVLVRKDGGAFDSRDVSLGLEIGDDFEVMQGLREGEQVVVSGQFLIDSEARLRSVTGRMTEPAPAESQPALYVGEGQVESVDAEGITISHGPVAELKWPPMTMGFGKPDPAAFGEVKPGDSVRFEFKKGGAMDYELVTVQRLGGAQ